MKTRTKGRAAGFSLIELMVAMVITLVVTGAIYGLIAGGQSAFRRDPEITERQQNIRIAMDRIQRDLLYAGAGVADGSAGPWVQVFWPGLDGAGTTPSALNAGQNTDVLQFLGDDGSCPPAKIGSTSGVNINTVGKASQIPACFPEPGMVFLIYEDEPPRWGWGWNIHDDSKKLNFPLGKQPPSSDIQKECDVDYSCGGGSAHPPKYAVRINIVRYEIAPDPTDGVPALWRTATNGFDNSSATLFNSAPDPADPAWQLLARGVEDLQVQYRDGGVCANWCDSPTVPDQATGYGTVTQEVRVTLSARTTSSNLAGATKAAGVVPNAIRGTLTTTSSPRMALYYLSAAPSPAPWQ